MSGVIILAICKSSDDEDKDGDLSNRNRSWKHYMPHNCTTPTAFNSIGKHLVVELSSCLGGAERWVVGEGEGGGGGRLRKNSPRIQN